MTENIFETMMKHAQLAICDLDGTLIDSRADLANAVNYVRANFSIAPLDVDTVTSFVGNGAENLVRRALSGHEVDIEKALALFKARYAEKICVETNLYPTVYEGLALLEKNSISVAVISNKPTEHCLKILDALGIRNKFDVIFGGDCHPLKPDPRSIFEAIKITGADIENTWMIGDSAVDAQSAKNAGIKACYARYGFFRVDETLFDMAADSFLDFCKSFVNKTLNLEGYKKT